MLLDIIADTQDQMINQAAVEAEIEVMTEDIETKIGGMIDTEEMIIEIIEKEEIVIQKDLIGMRIIGSEVEADQAVVEDSKEIKKLIQKVSFIINNQVFHQNKVDFQMHQAYLL